MRIKLDSSSLKILVCCHKPCVLPEDPDGIFLPVLGGAALLDSADADAQLAKWHGGGTRRFAERRALRQHQRQEQELL